jgi:hypothetical protein
MLCKTIPIAEVSAEATGFPQAEKYMVGAKTTFF